MPDPTSMSVDLAGSVRQDVPKAHVPPGSLWSATNVRRTVGGWRKRFAYESAGTTVSSLTGQSALGGPPHFVADFDGRHVYAGNMRISQRAGSSRPWQDAGRVARFKPERSDDIASGNLTGIDTASLPSGATSRRYVGVAYATSGSSNKVYFEVRDITSGAPGVVVFRTSVNNAVHPRIVGVGNNFIIGHINTSTSEVNISYIDTTTLTQGATTAMTILPTASDRYDIAPHDGTSNFILACRSATTVFRVWTRTSTNGVVSQATFTCTNEVYDHVSVAGTSGGIWVVYNRNAAGTTLRGAVLNAGLTATVTTETAITYVLDQIQSLSVIIRSSSTAWLTVGGSSSTCPKTHWGSLDTALFWTRNDFWSFFPTSRPVHVDSTNCHVWVSSRSNDSNVSFAPHILVRLTNGTGITDRLRRIELISDRKGFASTGCLSRVVTAFGDSQVAKQWIALPTYNYFSATNPTESVTLHCYTDVTTATYPAYELEACAADRVLYASGGCVQEVTDALPWGSSVLLEGAENSFAIPPYVASVTDVAGGSLTTGQTYQACVVWEYVDSQGRRTQSAPSNIVSQLLGGGDQTMRLTVDPLGLTDRFHRDGTGLSIDEGGGLLQAVVYVTGPGGSIFYRNVTIPKATIMVQANSWTIDITAVDQSEEILYIQSVTSFGNYPAPACKRIWYGGGRVWVGGLFSSREIECSRILRPGEPACFTRAAQFRVQFPENVNDGHYMDGACVVLTDTGIWVVGGDGPQNDGSNPFLTPQRVVSDAGGSRFLVEVPAGLLFLSDRGVFLLPRGFGAPVFIGARMQQSLGSKTIVGACLNGFTAADQNGERCVGIVTSDGHVFVFDADTLDFISDDAVEGFNAGYGCGTWDGKFVISGDDGLQYVTHTQNTSTFLASNTECRLTTGWIAPFGALGRGHVRRILTRAELRATDANGSLNTKISLVMTPDSTALYGNAATQTLSAGITGTAGDMVIVESNPPFQQCNALSLGWTISGNGAAVRLTGFALEGQGDPGAPKVQSALRTA